MYDKHTHLGCRIPFGLLLLQQRVNREGFRTSSHDANEEDRCGRCRKWPDHNKPLATLEPDRLWISKAPSKPGGSLLAMEVVRMNYDLDSAVQSPRPETPEPESRQGRRNPQPGVQLLDDDGGISDAVSLNQ